MRKSLAQFVAVALLAAVLIVVPNWSGQGGAQVADGDDGGGIIEAAEDIGEAVIDFFLSSFGSEPTRVVRRAQFNPLVLDPGTSDSYPDLCTVEGLMAFELPGTPRDAILEAEITIPPGLSLWGEVVNFKENRTSGNWGGAVSGTAFTPGATTSSGRFSYLAPYRWGSSDTNIDRGRIATNNGTEPARFRVVMEHLVNVSIGDADAPAWASLENLRFVDADGNETAACGEFERTLCIGVGNIYLEAPIEVNGVVYDGCVDYGSETNRGLIERGLLEDLIANGTVQLADGQTVTEFEVALHTAVLAVEGLGPDCEAELRKVESLEEFAESLSRFANDTENLLAELITVIRDVVDEAVTDPASGFTDDDLEKLQFQLLQDAPLEWIGAAGCEFLIEALIAGPAAAEDQLTGQVGVLLDRIIATSGPLGIGITPSGVFTTTPDDPNFPECIANVGPGGNLSHRICFESDGRAPFINDELLITVRPPDEILWIGTFAEEAVAP